MAISLETIAQFRCDCSVDPEDRLPSGFGFVSLSEELIMSGRLALRYLFQEEIALTDKVPTPIPFGTKDFCTISPEPVDVSPAWVFRSPYSGVYQVNVVITFRPKEQIPEGNPATKLAVQITVNGDEHSYAEEPIQHRGVGQKHSVVLCDLVSLVAGDSVQIHATQTSGSDLWIYALPDEHPPHTFVSIAEI